MPTLQETARLNPILEIECRTCQRYGKYRIENLIAKYGPQCELRGLADKMSKDCKNDRAQLIEERCSLWFPGLVRDD